MELEIIASAVEGLHQLGAVVMVGGLFFLLFILRPVSRMSMDSSDRQRFLYLVYRYLLRWLWLALLLLWGSGSWTIQRAGGSSFPLSFQFMAIGGVLVTVLTLIAHLTCYFSLSERIEAQHWGRAARISSHVRKVLALNLLVCLMLILVDAAGPHLRILA